MMRMRKKVRIKDLPKTLRPREKLSENGAENLSSAELLAIIFNTGSVKNNVIRLAESVLKKYPFQKFGNLNLEQLTAISGIGTAKASRLLASIELGRRLFAPVIVTKTIIISAFDVVKVVKEYADRKQEYLICLYLNARHELLEQEVLAVGALNSLRVEPREVFRPAFSNPCAGIILVHNHPSGDPAPSEDDLVFTKRIQSAGELMGIPLLDHVIISEKGYFSIKEQVVSR